MLLQDQNKVNCPTDDGSADGLTNRKKGRPLQHPTPTGRPQTTQQQYGSKSQPAIRGLPKNEAKKEILVAPTPLSRARIPSPGLLVSSSAHASSSCSSYPPQLFQPGRQEAKTDRSSAHQLGLDLFFAREEGDTTPKKHARGREPARRRFLRGCLKGVQRDAEMIYKIVGYLGLSTPYRAWEQALEVE